MSLFGSHDSKHLNQYGDEHYEHLPVATKFFTVLRQRCLDVDINISESVTFSSWQLSSRRSLVLYVRGNSMREIFVWMIYDYLCKIDGISNLEFKLPRFCCECVKFQLDRDIKKWWGDDADFDKLLPSADVLRECVRKRYMIFHKNASTRPYVDPDYAFKYLPIILVCSRFNICEDVEDIIHKFLGNGPINRYKYVSHDCDRLVDQGESKGGNDVRELQEHFRVWNSVNRIIWSY